MSPLLLIKPHSPRILGVQENVPPVSGTGQTGPGGSGPEGTCPSLQDTGEAGHPREEEGFTCPARLPNFPEATPRV